MQRILVFILPLLAVSCNHVGSNNAEPKFTKTDSTEIINVIIDSLRAEMYTQWFMNPKFKKFQCYISPDFDPDLQIVINKFGEIEINGETNPKSISELTLNFYSKNLNENDLTNNFPLYSELTKYDITSQIKKQENELETIKTSNNEFQEIIDMKQKMVDEWKAKLNALRTIGVNKIREPYYFNGIELKYPENCKMNEAVLDSILLGFYKIREIDSKLYFDESYAKIFWKATQFKDSIALQRLDAFKLLHPVYILDYGKSRYTPKAEKAPPPPVLEQ